MSGTPALAPPHPRSTDPGSRIRQPQQKQIRVLSLSLSLSVNLILWEQKSQPQCWWKPHPAPLLVASQGTVQHWAAATGSGGCTEAACRREEDAAGSAEAPGLVLQWEHPQGYVWSNNRGACDAPWGAAPLGHPLRCSGNNTLYHSYDISLVCINL